MKKSFESARKFLRERELALKKRFLDVSYL